MSDDKPQNEPPQPPPADPPASPPAPKYNWARDCRGHLTPESRPLVANEILRLFRAGEIRTIKGLAADFGLSLPTMRTFMESLGLIGGAGNQNKPGGVTVRTRAAETDSQKRKRREIERAQKRIALDAMKAQQEQVRRERRQAQAAADPSVDPPPDPAPDPSIVDPTVPAAKQRPKARADPDTPDLLAAFAVPVSFDALDRIRRIAAAPWIDVGKQLHACEILVKLSGAKGRVDWATLQLDQIPEEIRHRLAGQLVGWLEWAELPEVVRGAPAPCRQVFRLCGVLPTKVEDAEVVLARWETMRAELREAAGEVRADLKPKAPLLELDLAAETSYTAPQWEVEGGAN